MWKDDSLFFGDELARLMQRSGIPNTAEGRGQLAAACEVSEPHIRNILNDQRPVTIRFLRSLERALGVSLAYVFGGMAPPEILGTISEDGEVMMKPMTLVNVVALQAEDAIEALAVQPGEMVMVRPPDGALRSGAWVIVRTSGACRLYACEDKGGMTLLRRPGRPERVLFDPELHELVGVVVEIRRAV